MAHAVSLHPHNSTLRCLVKGILKLFFDLAPNRLGPFCQRFCGEFFSVRGSTKKPAGRQGFCGERIFERIRFFPCGFFLFGFYFVPSEATGPRLSRIRAGIPPFRQFMAHLIEKRDNVFLAVIPELFNGIGWHKLGKPTKEFTREALAPVLFEHSYKEAGIMTDNGFVATGERYVVAADDGLPVGPAVGSRYWTPSNAELFDVFSEALAGSDYKLVSALTVENRTQFALDAKAATIKAGRRDFSPYVGLHRAFGGKSSLYVCGHGTVMQCGNTTSLFLREVANADSLIVMRNSLGLKNRIPEFKSEIERIHGVNAEFAFALKEADEIPVAAPDARLAFAGLLTNGKPLVSTASGNVRTLNRVLQLSGLFRNGKANKGESLGDFYNAATEFYTHQSSGDNRVKQFMSSEFGSAREFKSRLTGKLFPSMRPSVDAFKELVERGTASVKASDEKELVAGGWNN